jgi:hypothetical protein
MFPLFNKKDEPATIRFLFDGDQVSWQDLKIIGRIQQAQASPEDIQLLMAHFLVDEKGKYLPEDKAINALDRLKTKEIQEVTTRFLEAMSEASIPKANGNGSNSHLEAGPAETFPNGSES